MAIDDRQALPILEELLVCLCSELARSPGGEPCFCGLVPGAQVAMDFCACDAADASCGMGWVRLDGLYPSSAFPAQDATARSCATTTALRVQLGVTRCLPDLHDDGEPPTMEEQHEAVQIQLGDLAAMRRALDCCLTANRRDWILGAYTPLGPAGGCGGGAFMVTVRVK